MVEENGSDAPDITGGPETGSEENPEQSSNLFPGMEIPKDIENLAREMKQAEIARKEQAEIEKENREQLGAAMAENDLRRFQIEVNGQDYEFEIEETSKVKSKKLNQEDD